MHKIIIIVFALVINVCGDENIELILINSTLKNVATQNQDFYGVNTYLLLDMFKFIPNMRNLSENCVKDIQELEDSIKRREIWAIKALESSAMVSPNFVYGNHFWLGSFEECRYINNPPTVTFTTKFYKNANKHLLEKPKSLVLDYKVTWANITNSPLEANNRYFRNREILHVGFCLPVSCSEDDVLKMSTEYLTNDESLVRSFYQVSVNDIQVSDLRLHDGFRYKFSNIMFAVGFLVTFVLIGISFLPLKVAKNETFMKMLLVFHPKRNLDTIFIPTATEFPEMNGMKFFGAVIILLFHVVYFSAYKLSSRFLGMNYAESLSLIIISNGPIFVELFLVMSGFLSAYNYLRNKEQTKELEVASKYKMFKFFMSNLFKRLVRIVPLYAMVIVMTELSASLVRDLSPIMIWDNDDINCQKYWWRNLLFINIFYTSEDICMNWSWTISLEMQCFIYCTILYLIYCKNKTWAKMVFWATAIGVTMAAAYSFFKYNFAFSLDVIFNLELYDATYISSTRAPPYLVGMALAYLLVKDALNISKQRANTLWTLAFVVIPLSIGCTANRSFHPWAATALVIPLKWLLPFSFGWIFVSPRIGHRNFLTEALAHETFYHFGKIAYAFYLVNPLLLIIMNGLSPNLLHVDTTAFFVYNAGITISSFVSAIILTILFEMPYIKLLRLKTKKPTKTKTIDEKGTIENHT